MRKLLSLLLVLSSVQPSLAKEPPSGYKEPKKAKPIPTGYQPIPPSNNKALAGYWNVTWHATRDGHEQTRKYIVGGMNEGVAISIARRRCKAQAIGDSFWTRACDLNPAVSYRQHPPCDPKAHYKTLGYPGSGHKTNFCKSQGFDSKEGDYCVRTCPSACEKVPILALGWVYNSTGHKTKFCNNNGYDGVHSFGDYEFGGYCYNVPEGKTASVCK